MNATTVVTTRPFARHVTSTRTRQTTVWALAGVAGTVLVAGGALFWAQSQSAPEVVVIPHVATGSTADVLGHGGAGQAYTGSTPIGLAGASSVMPYAGADLVAHGGGGTVWTVSGTKLR